MQGTRTKTEAIMLAAELLRAGNWVRVKPHPNPTKSMKWLVQWKEA